MYCDNCNRCVPCFLYEVEDNEGTYTMNLCDVCAEIYEENGHNLFLVYEE